MDSSLRNVANVGVQGACMSLNTDMALAKFYFFSTIFIFHYVSPFPLFFSSRLSSLRYWTGPFAGPTRISESTIGYTFTPCVGSFTSPGIDAR